MAISLEISTAVGMGIALVVAAGYWYAAGSVKRDRLETFARRSRLTITATNSGQVVRYLATTRRWRAAGFVGGLLASPFAFAGPGEISTGAEYITAFVGWFVGALVAEARVAHVEYASVRAASLKPRRPGQYVRPTAWSLVPAAAVVALVTGAATVVAEATGWGEPHWLEAGVWLGLALAVAVTVRMVQYAVLRRPQPLHAPDVVAADDAIRSRALHVLSGGGAALVLFLVLNQLGALHPVHSWDQSRVISIRVIGAFVVAFLGWLVATSLWPPPGTAHRSTTRTIGAS